jgi:hypothetical protein
MHVPVCAYIDEHVCTYINVHVCANIDEHVCTYMDVYVCALIDEYVCAYMDVHVCTYMDVNVYVCVYRCACMCIQYMDTKLCNLLLTVYILYGTYTDMGTVRCTTMFSDSAVVSVQPWQNYPHYGSHANLCLSSVFCV